MSGTEKLCSEELAKLRARWVKMNREWGREEAALLARGVPSYDLARHRKPVDWTLFTGLICGAKGKRTGNPCPSKAIYSNGRCRHHGGLSTGPTTAEGRAKSGRNGRGKSRTP
jgi:hypothetical protein